MFALLALDVKNTTISTTPLSTASGSSKTNVGAVVGGVVGGVGAAALILAAAFFWWRRRKAKSQEVVYEKAAPVETVESRIVSPEPYPYNLAANMSTPSAEPTTDTAIEQPPPIPLMSMKLREHLRQLQPVGPASSSSSSSGARSHTQTSGSGSRYSVDPPTTIGTSPSARSEIHGLRAEVENLRRYMEEMHAQHLDAPPSYVEE